MGWENVNAFPIIIISGTGPPLSGLFLYSPSVGAGHLVASGAAASGTDGAPGNAVLGPGWFNYVNTGAEFEAIGLQSGSLALYNHATEAGPWTLQFQLDQSGGVASDVTLGAVNGNIVLNSLVNSKQIIVQNTLAVTSPVNPAFTVLGQQQFTTPAAGGTWAIYEITGDTGSRLRIDTAGTGQARIRWGDGTGTTGAALQATTVSLLQLFNADLGVTTTGRGLQVAEGANAKQGTATLAAGTVTVANTAVTANSRIFLTAQNSGAAPGALRVSARTAGTSFTITSTSGTDTSLVAYEIFEPG